MSLEQNNPGNDLLERAVSALRDAKVPAGPPPEVVEETLARLGAGMESKPTRIYRRIIPMRLRTMLAVAAALAAASAPVVGADGTLYVTSNDSTLYALRNPTAVRDWMQQ